MTEPFLGNSTGTLVQVRGSMYGLSGRGRPGRIRRTERVVGVE